MEHFAEGRIKKIKMRNFMTYDHVELYPKKGLNLIVGLNGSGKSSIMCAISLGLAGKPHFTGRATHLSDFIKHGCQEAEIEIELEKANGSLLIRRKIKGEKCEWLLNRAVSNQNEVIKAVKQCNIDTSNLCQFLPQEKVLEFSRMDKKQRLENMLQTIGEPYLFQLFNELKDLSRSYIDMQQNHKKSLTKKISAVEENERIKDEVQKQESRVRLKKDLDEWYGRRKILQYENIRIELQTLKEKAKNLENELATLKEEQNEAISLENTISDKYVQYSNQKQQFTSQRNALMNIITLASENLRKLKEQAENGNIEYKNILIEVEEEKKRLHDLDKQIEGLQQYLVNGMRDLEIYQEQDQLNSNKLSQLQQELNPLSEEIDEVTRNRNEIIYSIEQCNKQLAELEQEQNKKLGHLRRCDKSSFTYKAALWLIENRHLFISNVYLPIMLEIKVHSIENCKYVENSIPFKDMIAFVCENKIDYVAFTDMVAQNEWPVNVVMPPDVPLTGFTSTPLESHYKNLGLQCYVSDLFTAPDPILRYLFSCYHLHRIPVATNAVLGHHTNDILEKYKCFFSGNFKIYGKKSRYGNRNMSQTKAHIMEKNVLTMHNDEPRNDVLQKLQALQENKVTKEKEIESLVIKRDELEKKQEKIRQEKKNFQDFNKRIAMQKDSYNRKLKSREQMSRIDVEAERQKITQKIRKINELRIKTLVELNKSLKEYVHFEKEIVKAILSMNSLSKSLKLTRAENEEVHEKVKTIEAALQTVCKEKRDKKHYGHMLLDEIRSSCVNDSTYLDLNAEDVEQKINHIQAQLSIEEDNEPLVAVYNARKQKIEEYQTEINNILCRLETIKEDIKEKKTEWLTSLQRHIKNINKKFSHYFKQLNCAGEINLDIPDNQDDFDNYGLQIKLKFRDEEPFVELSQTHHSGGECSVAAIVFILSLQELTEVPFRCIDEINQGMDSVNERKIYQLIADSVGDDKCSQYFLLTPKLLPGLQYPEDVAVHIIFNSCFLNIKLDVKKHLKLCQAV